MGRLPCPDISFFGIITWISGFFTETDCPYMAPEPHRGERNDPGYIPLICGKMAEIKGVSADEMAKRVEENAEPGPFLLFLKVSAPPKAMYSPSPAQRSAISALPEKQCITPFILPP